VRQLAIVAERVGSSRKETIRRLRFVTPGVAIVDVDTEVRGFGAMPAGVSIAPDGALRTRFQQVLVKRNGKWWIEAAHNIELKPPSWPKQSAAGKEPAPSAQ
jgi:hypothetical protein